MITEKDIQTRAAEILTDAGFNVVASEIDEGFEKPAVFVSAYPSNTQPQCCGGACALPEKIDSKKPQKTE